MEAQGTAYFLPDFSPVARGPFPIPFTLAPPASSLFVSVGKPYLPLHLRELLQGLLAAASSLDPATGSSELTIFENK